MAMHRIYTIKIDSEDMYIEPDPKTIFLAHKELPEGEEYVLPQE
jgi:hypothetical protein